MKKFLITLLIALCCVSCVACGSSSSHSSSYDWEKDANEAGYVKKNGKWYYIGK